MQRLRPHRHVIWDWNGTLLDDFPLIVEAVNEALHALGERPIDENVYRDHYTRPVRRFYEKVLGRTIRPAEWVRLDELFHIAYRRRARRAPLARDGWRALRTVSDSGATQSLLSMLRHDDLLPALRQRGLEPLLLSIDGLRRGSGERKAAHLGEHLSALRARLQLQSGCVDPERWVMIGDSLDDAQAAAEHGLSCVLYDGGCHHRAELERAGVPVAGSLMEALRLSGFVASTPEPVRSTTP